VAWANGVAITAGLALRGDRPIVSTDVTRLEVHGWTAALPALDADRSILIRTFGVVEGNVTHRTPPASRQGWAS
jgi:hypothetical protein